MRIAGLSFMKRKKGGSSRNTASSNKTFEKDIYCTLKSCYSRSTSGSYPVSIRSPCCAGYPIGSNRRIYSPFLYSKIRSCHIRSCKDDPITPSNRNRLLWTTLLSLSQMDSYVYYFARKYKRSLAYNGSFISKWTITASLWKQWVADKRVALHPKI